MAIDLLVLGLDGVMFDTEAAHLLSCNHALEQCGYDHRWSLQQFRNAALLHGAGNPFGAMARTSDSAMLHEEKERLFHELICESRVALHSGCVGLIEEALEEGCKLAIVTDLPASTATVLLEQAFCDRLTDMFAAIASSASVDFSSGNNAFHLVLRTVGADPWRSIAIDASTPALRAAQRAGFWTLATTPRIDTIESIDGSDAWHPDLRTSGHARSMENLAAARGRFLSFDSLDALKNVSRMNPPFTGTTAVAWA